ncbi:Deoxyribonuclease-2-alpha [Trichinella pseudospiralis]|uniref:Deoxyribonuclease-2-alpha n=1 Tax=Trichinella pseudospiralis TaxID=6337 RepID=A0A0V0YFX9_TRIPS|nr:Deoxyribonuclease-2-alpha [Trichinella pseudospiralis]
MMGQETQIGPTQANGKVLLSTAPGNWANGAAALTAAAGHSFAVSLTGVVANAADIKFLAYNNVPPAVPNVQTKSNSKGVIIVSTAAGANEGRWIVHTVPGFPAAKTGYNWPAAETAKGHLLICMTIAETAINAIASSLIRAEPFVYYNDIPESETAGMRDFKKLAEGQTATMPPFTIKQSIKIVAAAPVDVHIYSKSTKSRYGIKVKRQNLGWQFVLIKLQFLLDLMPLLPKLKIVHGEKQQEIIKKKKIIINSYTNTCFKMLTLVLMLLLLPDITISQNSKCKNRAGAGDAEWVILYKGPAQNTGKLLASDVPGNWADGAAVVTQAAGHSFAVILTDVVGNHANVKFLAYNNVPPGMPNVKTKSNGKGVIMISTAVNANDGAWIVHTVPGFPAAKTGYSWPAAEIAKGHLLICMTIAETQINAIAASLFRAEPFIYYNDIPESETAGMPDFKKLAEGKIPTMPPFTISRSIKLTGAGAVPVQIYSKSAKSRYEIYKKVILRGLKKTIKVWSRRDSKLKGDCRIPQRSLRLIKSPVQIAGHATNIETDESNWIVSEPGNIFCFMDKPYSKSQATEPALAVCFDQAAIFARFNTIAAQVENCPQ